jgi:hypothetical protein
VPEPITKQNPFEFENLAPPQIKKRAEVNEFAFGPSHHPSQLSPKKGIWSVIEEQQHRRQEQPENLKQIQMQPAASFEFKKQDSFPQQPR